MLTHLSSSLVGLTTIRSHRMQETCQLVFDEAQDVQTSARYMFLAASCWLSVWLDWICTFYIACVTFTCVALGNCINNILRFITLMLLKS